MYHNDEESKPGFLFRVTGMCPLLEKEPYASLTGGADHSIMNKDVTTDQNLTEKEGAKGWQ